MVEIKVTQIVDNKLLHRKEIWFEIDHYGVGSPERIEVKEKLAAMHTGKADLTYIQWMKPIFGIPKVKGFATIYDDEVIAKKLEAPFIRIRNMPKDQRDPAKKALKQKKKKKKKEA